MSGVSAMTISVFALAVYAFYHQQVIKERIKLILSQKFIMQGWVAQHNYVEPDFPQQNMHSLHYWISPYDINIIQSCIDVYFIIQSCIDVCFKQNGGVHSETCHEVGRHNATHLYVDVANGNETETADLVVEPLSVTAVTTCPSNSSQL